MMMVRVLGNSYTMIKGCAIFFDGTGFLKAHPYIDIFKNIAELSVDIQKRFEEKS